MLQELAKYYHVACFFFCWELDVNNTEIYTGILLFINFILEIRLTELGCLPCFQSLCYAKLVT